MEKFAELLESIENYFLLSTSDKILGPYTRRDGRQIIIIRKDDGTQKTMSFPKWLYTQTHGDIGELTIDHLDFDINNNDMSNLRAVPRDEHSADDTRRVKLIKLKCSMCDKEFERSPRVIRDKAKKGTGGSFCSRKCSGKYSRQRQLGLIDKMKSPQHIESEYYRRKNVQAFSEYLISKYGDKLATEESLSEERSYLLSQDYSE